MSPQVGPAPSGTDPAGAPGSNKNSAGAEPNAVSTGINLQGLTYIWHDTMLTKHLLVVLVAASLVLAAFGQVRSCFSRPLHHLLQTSPSCPLFVFTTALCPTDR